MNQPLAASRLRQCVWSLFLAGMMLAACRQDAPPPASPDPAASPTALVDGGADNTSAPPSDDTAPTATPLPPTPTVQPTVTPTPVPPKVITICMGNEPESLYLYGDESPAAVGIRHALYESPFTSLGFAYQPLALVQMPSLANDDARIVEVNVSEGDMVVTANGSLTTLGPGIEVLNSAGELVVYSDAPITMRQLEVDYTFRPLVWSDGTPLTADDSVFSYELAADPNTPRLDNQIRFTAAYEAVDERTVRWTGLPGYVDPTYMTHVWTPLPRHQLGELTADEVVRSPDAALAPLSYGAFQVSSWEPGVAIELTPNPHYDRQSDGLPLVQRLVVRFIGESLGSLPPDAAECDVITQDALTTAALPDLVDSEAAGGLAAVTVDSPVIEYMIYGVEPVPFYAGQRPDWFEQATVRQGMALCIDRQGLVEDLTGGRSTVTNAYVPQSHPLYPDDLATWEYDPVAGNALLDEAGYVARNEEGIRLNIDSTIPFSITLGTNSESPLRLQIIERIAGDLAACGIRATPESQLAATWFAPGPVGPVFGRRFDLAQFAWLGRIEPGCDLFETRNIPGPEDQGFVGWSGVNVSGWSSEAYDTACDAALALLPGQPGYEAAHSAAMVDFAQQLPALPLFTRLKVSAVSPELENYRLDVTQPSDMWNVFEWDIPFGE